MQEMERGLPVTGTGPGRWWWARLLPAWVLAAAAAGAAVACLAAGWQHVPVACTPQFPEFRPAACQLHPAAQAWGAAGAAVLAVIIAAVSAPAARRNLIWDSGRPWRATAVAAAAGLAAVAGLVTLAVTVTTATRMWTSQQLLPGAGGQAAVISVIAAAAAGLLTGWAVLTWSRSRRAAWLPGVAVIVVAAAIAITTATAGWSGLSTTATTAAPEPAPSAAIAAAPSHLLWQAQGSPGGGSTTAGGLVIQVAHPDFFHAGVQALSAATGQVRWQYLRGSNLGDPAVSMSAQAVGLFYPGLPAVFLNAATGRPEPLTRPAPTVGTSRAAAMAMIGTTYVQADRDGQVAATSAVTGQRLWAHRIADCPGLTVSPDRRPAFPLLARAGSVIAMFYTCSPPHAGTSAHLALFGRGRSLRLVTLAASSYIAGLPHPLLVAGTTVLASVAHKDYDQTVAVSAATGAVLWTMAGSDPDAGLGSGQVLLTRYRRLNAKTNVAVSCGQYAAASGQLISAWPASSCSTLDSGYPYVAAGGHVYVASVVGRDGLPLPRSADRTRISLRLVTLDASGGATAATTIVALPASAAASDFDVSYFPLHAAGNTLIVPGGNAAAMVLFAVR